MNAKITFVELVDLIAESTSTTKRVCDLFLRELFSTISQSLINGEQVKIKGVGTFKVTQVKPRKSYDVNTGDAIEISAYKRITFTPDKSLAEAVNNPFAQFEPVILDDKVTDEKLAEIDQQFPSEYVEPTELPEPPDFPEPPALTPDEIPAVEGQPLVSPAAKTHDPVPVKNTLSLDESKDDQIEETKQETPEAPVSTDEKDVTKSEDDETVKADEDVRHVEDAVKVPPVMGRPIAGPREEEEPVESRGHYYRPEPRNAYKPTEEQLSTRKSKLPWLWLALAVLALGAAIWLFARGGSSGGVESKQDVIPIEADTVAVVEPAVITDTVTAQIVLSTLSDKYYDSPWFWVYIYEENKGIISDPNNVRPGTEVVIPPAEKYGIDAKDPKSLKRAQLKSWEILKGK